MDILKIDSGKVTYVAPVEDLQEIAKLLKESHITKVQTGGHELIFGKDY